MQAPSTSSLSESNPLSNLGFDELLALADAAWAHSNASLPGNDDGLRDQYPSILTFKSPCMDDPLTIHDSPQGTSCTSFCSMTTSQFVPPISERRQAAAMQINMEEKYQGQKTKNVPAKKIDNNDGTPHSKEGQPKTTQKTVSPKPAQSNNDQTGKRMCVTRKILNKNSTAPTTVVTVESTKEMMPESAKTCCSRYLNFDKGARDESSSDKENATVHVGKENGVVVQEMNTGLVCEVNSSMKQASNYMSFPNGRQAPSTSPSKSNPPGEKPMEIPAAQRKHVRRKGLNKIYAPPTEVTGKEATMSESNKMSWRRSLNFDIGTTDESSVDRENLNVHICKENSLVVEETHVGLSYNQAPSSFTSKSNSPRAKPKERPPAKRKYVIRKGLNKTSTPTEMTGELTESMIPESSKISCRWYLNFDKGKRKYVRRKGLNKTSTPPTEVTGEFTEEMPESSKMSCRRSLNFDIEARDERSAGRENTTALLGKENGVLVQDTNVGLAYDLNTSIKQASNSCMSLPEDTQAPNTSSQRTHPGAKPKEKQTGKRKCVRRKGLNKTFAPPTEVTGELATEKMPECAKPPCESSINFDRGAREESSEVKENATTDLGKEAVVTQEMDADLAHDVNTSMKQASNSYISLTEDTQATNTSSRRKPHGEKPKESPTAKRKYVRRSELNKSSTPTEVSRDLTKEMMPESIKTSCRRSLNLDEGARDESSADTENATVHLGKEIGVVMQEMDVGLTYNLNTSMKQAANNYMSFPNEQAPSTSPSKSNPPGTKPKENPTGKRKYVRRKGLKKSPTPPTEMARELTEAMMPESKEMPRRRSSNFDRGTKDESSAGRESLSVRIGNVVEETHVGLAYNKDNWMKQALNSYMSLPEDTQAPSTSSKSNPPEAKPKKNPTGKRKYERKKRLNKTSTPTEMTGLTVPVMSESTIISCRRSLNFDKGGRDESNMCRESLACDQNTLMKEALYNYMSLSENTQAPSTSLSKSNPPGAKLNANSVEEKNKRKVLATAQDGNISNSQISTIRLQMVGSERTQSGTIRCEANSSINLIGAHCNGLPSYQSKFRIQFPNIQKKRRTEKGKTSNTHITSSVTTEEEVPLTCAQEDAQVHLYASNSSCWMYGSGYNAAIVPAVSESTENVVNNTQTFDEFILSLRRIFQSPTKTCNCNSLMRIRNCDAEPNYIAKQLGISQCQTFGDAERPQTCTDVLVAEMHGSHAKKKRNRKRKALCSSAHLNTNEMQQHHNFALANPHLPLGKSSDIAHEVIRIQFPNIQKKRRTEKGKTSNTHITSSVTTEKELPLTCAQEDAQVHPYASNSSCWMYGSGYNAAKVPAISESTETVFDNTQTFTELLRRVTERSGPPTQICDYASPTRIRNCDKHGISQRPQTCIDDLVAETRASLTEKNQNRRKSVLSSSAYSSTNEKQRHHNFALGNSHLPLRKSVDVSREVLRKTVRTVDALAEQFRQLNINTEARDLAFHKQNSPVLCKQPYPWRWHHHSLSGHI